MSQAPVSGDDCLYDIHLIIPGPQSVRPRRSLPRISPPWSQLWNSEHPIRVFARLISQTIQPATITATRRGLTITVEEARNFLGEHWPSIATKPMRTLLLRNCIHLL